MGGRGQEPGYIDYKKAELLEFSNGTSEAVTRIRSNPHYFISQGPFLFISVWVPTEIFLFFSGLSG